MLRPINVLAVVGCFVAYVAPYVALESVPWRFAAATAVILTTGFALLGRDALRLFGLQLTRRDILSSLALFLVLLPIAYWVLRGIVVTGSLTAQREILLRSQVHQLFQVLNDEMLMRAALLTIALRACPRPKVLVVTMALLSVTGHALAYGLDGIRIEVPALVTLFCLATVANTLFVRYRHIGYGFALHYAWNFWRFSTRYYLGGRYLPEGATFNYIEGNPWIVAGGSLVTVAVLAAYSSWAQSSSRAPAA